MTDYKPFFLLVILTTWFLLKQLFVYPDYRPAPINLQALIQSFPVTAGEISNNVSAAKVICQPDCWLDVAGHHLPARLANDSAGRLRQLQLRFVDEGRGLVGYDNALPSNPEFYVINFDGELLQVVQLDLNHVRRLEFAGYYPQTAQILFNSSDGRQWRYSANRPSLESL